MWVMGQGSVWAPVGVGRLGRSKHTASLRLVDWFGLSVLLEAGTTESWPTAILAYLPMAYWPMAHDVPELLCDRVLGYWPMAHGL